MNDTRTGDRLVTDYLRNVDLLLDHLPRARRQEILEGLAEHIADARAGLPAGRAEDVTTILARVGTPEQIAAVEAEGTGQPPRHAGGIEIVTMVALLGGILLLPAVSLFVGTAVMWFSKVWGRRDKLLVTGVAAVGAAALAAGTTTVTTVDPVKAAEGGGDTSIGLMVLLFSTSTVLLPIVAACILGRTVWSRRSGPADVTSPERQPAWTPTGGQAAPAMVWPATAARPVAPPPLPDPAKLARQRRIRNWLALSGHRCRVPRSRPARHRADCALHEQGTEQSGHGAALTSTPDRPLGPGPAG
jgi:uncharacterized membrane protein